MCNIEHVLVLQLPAHSSREGKDQKARLVTGAVTGFKKVCARNLPSGGRSSLVVIVLRWLELNTGFWILLM